MVITKYSFYTIWPVQVNIHKVGNGTLFCYSFVTVLLLESSAIIQTGYFTLN